MIAVLGAGSLVGSFYGLAPLYASQQGLSTELVGLYMGCCIFAGLLVQWPLGWLSDRYDRPLLIRIFAFILAVVSLPLAILPSVPLQVLFAAGCLSALVQFCIYPLAVAFANDHIEGERRVSLTAMLLVTYGIGASIGPLVTGVLMKLFGSHMLYAFFSVAGLLLVWRIRPNAVTNLHQVDDAPLHHVAMPDSMSSSPLVAALDPRVDEQVVQDQMVDNIAPEPEAEHSEPEIKPEP